MTSVAAVTYETPACSTFIRHGCRVHAVPSSRRLLTRGFDLGWDGDAVGGGVVVEVVEGGQGVRGGGDGVSGLGQQAADVADVAADGGGTGPGRGGGLRLGQGGGVVEGGGRR